MGLSSWQEGATRCSPCLYNSLYITHQPHATEITVTDVFFPNENEFDDDEDELKVV